jgi:hypothetical protein
MVTSKSTLEIIREIIKKHYARLTVSILGRSELTAEELKILEDAGYDTKNKDSLLSLVYNHSFINHPPDSGSPTSISEMKSQQSVHKRELKRQDEAIHPKASPRCGHKD